MTLGNTTRLPMAFGKICLNPVFPLRQMPKTRSVGNFPDSSFIGAKRPDWS